MTKFESRLVTEIAAFKLEVRDEIAGVKDEIRDMLKWTIGLWATQMLAIVGFFSATFFYLIQKIH